MGGPGSLEVCRATATSANIPRASMDGGVRPCTDGEWRGCCKNAPPPSIEPPTQFGTLTFAASPAGHSVPPSADAGQPRFGTTLWSWAAPCCKKVSYPKGHSSVSAVDVVSKRWRTGACCGVYCDSLSSTCHTTEDIRHRPQSQRTTPSHPYAPSVSVFDHLFTIHGHCALFEAVATKTEGSDWRRDACMHIKRWWEDHVGANFPPPVRLR